MPNLKQANPGAPQGTEIVFLGSPFGGWTHNPSVSNGSGHLVASTEGVQAAIAQQVHNQYAESDGVSLFRSDRFGHMAPGKIYSAITDAGGGTPHINDLPLNGANRQDSGSYSDTWVVLKNGRIVRFQLNLTVNVYDPTLHALGTALTSTTDNDILMMLDLATPTSVDYVVWSWEDDIGGDIGIRDAAAGTTTPSWFSGLSGSTTLKKGVPHKLCKGPDGNLYVLDGAYVRQIVINGAMGSATLGLVLPLGAGWTGTGIVAYKNYVAITASSGVNTNRGESAMFLWNGQSSTVNGVTSTAPQFIFPIPDNYANGLNFDGHVLYVFSNGRNNTSKIFEFTGKDFKQVFETPLLTLSTSPIQGSIENNQDSMLIGTVKNSLARICRFYAGGFHDEGTLTDGSHNATQVGMVKQFTSNYLYVGIKQGSTYQIYYDGDTQSNYQTGVALRTILYTQGILGRRMYPLGFKGTVNRIQIFLSQWGTGASLTLSLFKDYATAGVGGANDLLNKVLDTTSYPAGTTEIDISDIAIVDISAFYMILTWSHASTSNVAAIVRHMVVHISPSQ